MGKSYKGRAQEEDYGLLMAMLDDVFFTDDEEPKRGFLSLLPKLYKKEYSPCFNNFTVMKDGSFKGAVGLYPIKWNVAGEEIKIGGIGNVAVAKDSRKEGYMKECLQMAVDASLQNGDDMMMLDGDRHRYGYFGFEPMGSNRIMLIRMRDLVHSGIDVSKKYDCHVLTENDSDIIDSILSLHSSKPYNPCRSREKLVDTLRSWESTPYYVTDNGEFTGYFIVNREGNAVSDFVVRKAEDYYKLALCAFEVIKPAEQFEISLPEFEQELINTLIPVCGRIDLCRSEYFNIFNYEKVIRSYLTLKASYMPLCDGEITILIHGYRSDETLKIAVTGNKASVQKSEGKADIELSHREAERLLGALCSGSRMKLPANIQQWFPLPFYAYSADAV